MNKRKPLQKKKKKKDPVIGGKVAINITLFLLLSNRILDFKLAYGHLEKDSISHLSLQ